MRQILQIYKYSRFFFIISFLERESNVGTKQEGKRMTYPVMDSPLQSDSEPLQKQKTPAMGKSFSSGSWPCFLGVLFGWDKREVLT